MSEVTINEGDIVAVSIYGSTAAIVNQISLSQTEVMLTLINGPYQGECFIRTIYEVQAGIKEEPIDEYRQNRV